MKYQNLGTSGIEVSRVAFGAWQIGGGTAWDCTDDSACDRIVSALPDMGINFIDTAKVYGTGRSEMLLGKALKGKRHDFILSSKGGMNWRDGFGEKFCYNRDGQTVYQNTSAKALRLDLEESLTRLDTDYLDVYFTHRQPITVPIEETMGALLRFKEEGKIRAIGISNATIPQLEEYLKYGKVDVVQEKFSLFDRGTVREYIEFCKAHDVTFQAYSVLERGILTGKFSRETEVHEGQGAYSMLWYARDRREAVMGLIDKIQVIADECETAIPVVAMAYALCTGEHINAICGGRRPEHIAQSAFGADLMLTQDQIQRIDSAVDALHEEFGCSTHKF